MFRMAAEEELQQNQAAQDSGSAQTQVNPHLSSANGVMLQECYGALPYLRPICDGHLITVSN